MSFNFGAVQEEEELGLVSCIEEKLHLWGGVAVDLDMSKSCVVIAEVFVVLFDLLTNWVPSGMEIKASKSWFILIEVSNNI